MIAFGFREAAKNLECRPEYVGVPAGCWPKRFSGRSQFEEINRNPAYHIGRLKPVFVGNHQIKDGIFNWKLVCQT